MKHNLTALICIAALVAATVPAAAGETAGPVAIAIHADFSTDCISLIIKYQGSVYKVVNGIRTRDKIGVDKG